MQKKETLCQTWIDTYINMHTIYTLAVAVLFGWWRRWICTHTIYKAVITMFIVTDNLHFKALRWWTGNKNLFKAKVALVIWMAKLIYVPLSKYKLHVECIFVLHFQLIYCVFLVRRPVSLWVCFAQST